MSSVAARFFPPQVAGAGATVGQSGQPFRIDHDEKFNQTTHLQYQFGKRGPWAGFNWRYDSGLVAGAMPFAVQTNTTPVDLSALTNDRAVPGRHHVQRREGHAHRGLPVVRAFAIPFDAGANSRARNGERRPEPAAHRAAQPVRRDSVGKHNIFRKEHYKTDFDLTAINVTNKYALYQLPVDVQRNALRNSARADSEDDVQLLRATSQTRMGSGHLTPFCLKGAACAR